MKIAGICKVLSDYYYDESRLWKDGASSQSRIEPVYVPETSVDIIEPVQLRPASGQVAACLVHIGHPNGPALGQLRWRQEGGRPLGRESRR